MTPERPRTRTDRIETLHAMLTHYTEARSEAGSGGGGGSRPESRLLAFDASTWTREYEELERCLNALRYLAQHGRPMIEQGVSSAAAWWHLRARYLEAETVRREVHFRKTHSGERVPARLPSNMEVVARATILNGRTGHMMVRVWDARVDPRVVAAGLRWLSAEFRGSPAVYSEES
jgi:hypothetical protein